MRHFKIDRGNLAELDAIRGRGFGAKPRFVFDDQGDPTGELVIELPDQAAARFARAVGRPVEPPGYSVRVDSAKRNKRAGRSN